MLMIEFMIAFAATIFLTHSILQIQFTTLLSQLQNNRKINKEMQSHNFSCKYRDSLKNFKEFEEDECSRCKLLEQAIELMIKKNQKLECDNYANEITIVFLKNQNTDLIRKMEENNEDKERLQRLFEENKGEKQEEMLNFIQTFNPVELKKLLVTSVETKISLDVQKKHQISNESKCSKKMFNLKEFTQKAKLRYQENKRNVFQLSNL